MNSPVAQNHSLMISIKKKEQEKIQKENQMLLEKLKNPFNTISNKHLSSDWE